MVRRAKTELKRDSLPTTLYLTMGAVLQKLLINWTMFNANKSDQLGTYLGIGFKSSFRNLMQRVESSLNSTIEVLSLLRVMVFVFVALIIISQCVMLYSIVMMNKRLRVMESRNDNSNSNYSSQHTNLSLRGIGAGPETKSSKVPTTMRTNHLYTDDEIRGL